MSVDLRCPAKKHGVVVQPGRGGEVEVKCDSRFCGAVRGAVVLHTFSTESGKLVKTRKFKNPERK